MDSTILIVDEKPDELVPVLRHAGYRTLTVTHEQQALALAAEAHPDIILLGVELDGIETCRRLRTNPLTADIPVILVSERSPHEARSEGLIAGASDYVTRPVDVPDLLERIAHFNDGLSPDHDRLVEQMAYTVLAVLPCHMVWLLSVEKDWLVHRAVAIGEGVEQAHHFLALMQADYPDVRFSLVRDDNPLAEVALTQMPLMNITAYQLRDLVGGMGLSQMFTGMGFEYLSLLPLVTGARTVGMMVLAAVDAPVAESRRTYHIVEALGNQAATLMDSIHLFDRMRRRVAGLSTLLEASAAVSSTLDFGDVLEQIAYRLSTALQVERVVIADRNRQSNHLETLAEVVNAYWPPEDGPVRRIDDLPLTCSVFESGMMMLATDTMIRGAPQPVLEVNHAGMWTIGGFPFFIADDVMGVVTLHSEAPQYHFQADQVAVIVRAIDEWAHGARAVGEWWSWASLTDLCLRVLQAGDVRWCVVSYWDRTQNKIRLLREMGRALWLKRPGQTWDVAQYPSLAEVLESGEATVLRFEALDHDPNEQAYLRRVGADTCLVTPLPVRGEPSGLVKLFDSRRARRGFDRSEVSLCQGIANVVGNALENAQLYTLQERRASALEAAYIQLQESDRIKDELMQNLSHELRTPLTHILGYLRLLTDNAFGPLTVEQAESLELVVDKAQHLADLVKDIVAVQASDTHSLEPKAVQLDRVVALAIRSMAGQAQERGIEILARTTTSLPPAYVDPVRVGEVFEELLENAIKFSPGNTQIVVTLEDPGGPMLHAAVQDYGIGIDPAEQGKIFHRFYQVDSGTTRRFGGTGLGLAIVRQVIEGHSGRVWVESEPGQGSCFHLTLPKLSAVVQDG